MLAYTILLLIGLATADDWWTTAAPEDYQCALEFVPKNVLTRAAAYQQLFLKSLTNESPDYWGTQYGGSQYNSKCQTGTASDDLTTIIVATQDVTFTVRKSSTSYRSLETSPEVTSTAPQTRGETHQYTTLGPTTSLGPTTTGESSYTEATATSDNASETPTDDAPFGSNPFGSNPFGSNPFGSNPFGSNPFGTGA